MEFLVELDVTSTSLFSIIFYVLGFYFLFCCVEVSSVVLRCIVLQSVLLCLFCCVALYCDPLCCCCVVSVELRCIVLHCDPLCCVAL